MADIATRFAADLFRSATVEGKLQSRSAKQQLDHWARLGRAIANQQSVARRKVEAALSGEISTAALSDEEAAVFNAEIAVSIEERIAAADIGAGLTAQHIAYVALDDSGALVEYRPDGSSVVIAASHNVSP